MKIKQGFRPAVAVLVFLLLAGCQAQAAPKAGTLDFSLRDLQGRITTLAEYRQKQPVIVFFWTTWCPYCRKELQVLNDQYQEVKDAGFSVLAVNAGESQGRVSQYFKGRDLHFPVLLDQNTSVSSSWGILGVPTYIIVNKEGKEVFRGHSFPADTYKDFR